MASEAFLQKVNEAVRFHESQSRLSSIQSHLLVQLDGEVSFVLLSSSDTTLDRTMWASNWWERPEKILLELLSWKEPCGKPVVNESCSPCS